MADTFQIVEVDDAKLAAMTPSERAQFVTVPSEHVDALRKMNRKARRTWLALRRKAGKVAAQRERDAMAAAWRGVPGGRVAFDPSQGIVVGSVSK